MNFIVRLLNFDQILNDLAENSKAIKDLLKKKISQRKQNKIWIENLAEDHWKSDQKVF